MNTVHINGVPVLCTTSIESIKKIDNARILSISDLDNTEMQMLDRDNIELVICNQPAFHFCKLRLSIISNVSEYLVDLRSDLDITNSIILIGPTNVGKSSLANSLTNLEAAIVRDEMFTTEGCIRLRSLSFDVIDSEGFTASRYKDTLPVMHKEIYDASVVCVVLDKKVYNERISKKLINLMERMKKDFIIIFNKSDQLQRYEFDSLSSELSEKLINNTIIFTSKYDMRTIDAARTRIYQIVHSKTIQHHSTSWLKSIICKKYPEIVYVKQNEVDRYVFICRLRRKMEASSVLKRTIQRLLASELKISNLYIDVRFICSE